METIVLAINGIYLANQMRLLPRSFVHHDRRIVWHAEPATTYNDNVRCDNYDVCIDFQPYPTKPSIFRGDYFIPRVNKLQQFVDMTEIKAKGLKELKQFYVPRTWTFSSDILHPPIKPGKYVLKVTDGARGIGQYLVDTQIYNIGSVITDLERMDTFDEFREKYPKIKFNMNNHRTNEAEGSPSNCQHGEWILQELLDIQDEYRLLVFGESIYAQKRTILNQDGYPQPNCGSELVCEVKSLNELKIPKAVIDGIRKLLVEMDITYGSVDLALGDFGWTVLEWSNQYYTNTWPANFLESQHMDYFGDLVTKIYEHKKKKGKSRVLEGK